MNKTDHVIPVHGLQAQLARALTDTLIEDNEIVSTTDQKRVFLKDVLLNPLYHGTVLTDGDMLGLNASSDRGVWPGDTVNRLDTGAVMICISNNGEADGDWAVYVVSSSGTNAFEQRDVWLFG